MTQFQNSAKNLRSRAAVAERTAGLWRWTVARREILMCAPAQWFPLALALGFGALLRLRSINLYGKRSVEVAVLLVAVVPYHVNRQVVLDGPITFFSTLRSLLAFPAVAAGTASNLIAQEQISTAGHCCTSDILNFWSVGGGGITEVKLSPETPALAPGIGLRVQHGRHNIGQQPEPPPALPTLRRCQPQKNETEPHLKLVIGDGLTRCPTSDAGLIRAT
jgi:hypothetical protein